MKSRALTSLNNTGYLIIVLLLGVMSIQIDTSLLLSDQWQLLRQPDMANDFEEIFFLQAQLPRLVMTLLVGGVLGLTGSLMQQLTQNNLTSPLTLGTSSGAAGTGHPQYLVCRPYSGLFCSYRHGWSIVCFCSYYHSHRRSPHNRATNGCLRHGYQYPTWLHRQCTHYSECAICPKYLQLGSRQSRSIQLGLGTLAITTDFGGAASAVNSSSYFDRTQTRPNGSCSSWAGSHADVSVIDDTGYLVGIGLDYSGGNY